MRVLAVSLATLIAALPLAAQGQESAPPPAPPAAAPRATPPPPAAAPPAPPPAPPPPPAQWKAQAKAGLVSVGGNSRTTTITGGANVSRTDPSNKVALDGVVAYGESSVLVVRDRDGDGLSDPDERERPRQITVNNWMVKGRYDRFLTANQGAFLAASTGADEVAGKAVIGGAQAGWSAKLVKTATQELVAELGYDFSYEEYFPSSSVKPVEIHSGRAFVGETLKLSASAGLAASVEVLANLNEEKNAPRYRAPSEKVEAFDDVRVNGKLALTAAIRSNVSLSVGFTVKYDGNPAPLAIAGAPPYAPGYFPFANTFDTVTDAALIVTFL